MPDSFVPIRLDKSSFWGTLLATQRSGPIPRFSAKISVLWAGMERNRNEAGLALVCQINATMPPPGDCARSSTAPRRRPLATCPGISRVGCVVVLSFLISHALALPQSQPNAPGAPASDVSNIPKPIMDTLDRVNQRDAPRAVGEQGSKAAEKEVTCLLPPLTLMSSPAVAVEQLQRAGRARSEYQQGCAALRRKKSAETEKHFRKALREYPKYATAWVTLGQVLATQQKTDQARNACFQGSIVDPTYVPAYLCLADIAARAHAWDEVLKLSGRALELDPSANAVAYEYHAAANLNLRNLDAAEKSGLRAVEIDRDHREPRVHFVLAQIYEAKGDSASEAVHLREYLKYCENVADAAKVEQYLANLEGHMTTPGTIDHRLGSRAVGSVMSSMRDWGPPDIDASVPPVLGNGACPLSQILNETSNRTLDLIESMQRFSASERIEQIDIDKNGRRRNSSAQTVNYVVQIEQKSSGYPSIQEYRSEGTGIRQASVMDFGTAAFALIFHPTHVGNFDFRCEGLTELQGSIAWQVHFEESTDSNRSFSAIRIGGSTNLTRLKGRAWIATDSYNVLRIETDLVAPIARIHLQREHLVITYTPVEFPGRHIRLWLPDSSSLYIAYRGHRYERVHTFSQFHLFSVETTEAVKDPIVNQACPFLF
jgi:tetratricopeptide (TPR) repeat protein